MSISKSGVIEAVATKQVTTRFGEKDTYSFKMEGEWYNAGFQKVPAKGSNVSFQYDEGRWGKELVKKSLTTNSAAGTAPAAVGGGANNSSQSARPVGSKGVFPVPTYDGQRSIIRQNATTNANYLLRTVKGEGSGNMPIPTNIDEYVTLLINTARQIESYTTGDADAQEAKKIAAATIAQAEWEQQKQAGEQEAGAATEEFFNG
jgi:hypothetical protein